MHTRLLLGVLDVEVGSCSREHREIDGFLAMNHRVYTCLHRHGLELCLSGIRTCLFDGDAQNALHRLKQMRRTEGFR